MNVKPAAAVVALIVALPSGALAAWSGSGSGGAAGAAATMPAGAAPTARGSGGSVTVAWNAAVMSNGVAVAAYTVQRYDAITGSEATVGAGCAGVITATSCTETNVPSGSWTYTDTPVQQSWTGSESASSAAVGLATPLSAGTKPPAPVVAHPGPHAPSPPPRKAPGASPTTTPPSPRYQRHHNHDHHRAAGNDHNQVVTLPPPSTEPTTASPTTTGNNPSTSATSAA